MHVRQLQAFRAVVELGSVTRAAEILGISQPAISKLIASLGQDCGFQLFVRSGNRLVPTAEALSLFREVDRVFVSVDHIARHASAIREQRSGQLAIGAFPALATRPLPRLLRRFASEHPDIRLSLLARSGRLLVELIAADRADLGISLLMSDHPGVAFEPAGSVEAVCVMSPRHRLAKRKFIRAADLENEPFISLGTEDQSRFRVDAAFENSGIRRKIVIEAHQSEAACTFASEGAGIALVEPFSASEFTASQLAVRPFRPVVRFDIWLMTPIYRPRSLLAESFMKMFRRSLPEYAKRALGAR